MAGALSRALRHSTWPAPGATKWASFFHRHGRPRFRPWSRGNSPGASRHLHSRALLLRLFDKKNAHPNNAIVMGVARARHS
eukprot:9954683-Alexandrium_andersonii.AAC.1